MEGSDYAEESALDAESTPDDRISSGSMTATGRVEVLNFPALRMRAVACTATEGIAATGDVKHPFDPPS